MSPAPTPKHFDEAPPPSGEGGGLRLRLWAGSLGAALAMGAALWWVAGSQPGAGAAPDPVVLFLELAAVAGGGVLLGVLLALWLDRGIVRHLQALSRGLAHGDVAELRGLHPAAGWGELAALTDQFQQLLGRHREALRAAEELARAERQLAVVRATVERWLDSERWEALAAGAGPVGPVVAALNRAFRRVEQQHIQNREAAVRIGSDVEQAVGEARESAEQAERGFVEATALLTTVRELQRLAGELQAAVEASRGTAYEAPNPDETLAATRVAIEELVSASTESVEHLSRGMLRIQEVADQVHQLANRSTLIALNVAVAVTREDSAAARMGGLAEELRALARDVRVATDRTAELSLAVEQEVAAAVQRMGGVRARVAQALERLPAAPVAGPARPVDDQVRLLERVREMVQDATQKGERLSAAGERASRAAERLVRRMESEARELESLAASLLPLDAEPESPTGAGAPPALPGSSRSPAEPATRLGGLRLLGRENLIEGEEHRPRRKEERP